MTSSVEFPTLEQFFSGYFHQDWCDEFESPDAVLSAYRSGESRETQLAAKAELDSLKRQNPDETSLAHSIQRLGCYYDPISDGLTYHEWITSLEFSLR